jgi:hypothetical protein
MLLRIEGRFAGLLERLPEAPGSHSQAVAGGPVLHFKAVAPRGRHIPEPSIRALGADFSRVYRRRSVPLRIGEVDPHPNALGLLDFVLEGLDQGGGVVGSLSQEQESGGHIELNHEGSILAGSRRLIQIAVASISAYLRVADSIPSIKPIRKGGS